MTDRTHVLGLRGNCYVVSKTIFLFVPLGLEQRLLGLVSARSMSTSFNLSDCLEIAVLFLVLDDALSIFQLLRYTLQLQLEAVLIGRGDLFRIVESLIVICFGGGGQFEVGERAIG